MAHLTKAQTKAHKAAVELLAKEVLTYDEREFVLNNWHEAAHHVNGAAGAFFTPLDLAWDFGIDAGGGRVIDLCAGIGALAFAVYHRGRNGGEAPKVVCVEVNPEYVAVGRKVLPEATWIEGDVFALQDLGFHDVAIANPPFGPVRRSGSGPRYTGPEFELQLIDLAADIARRGVFIIPTGSAPFAYSGVQCYREVSTPRTQRFLDQTKIRLDVGCGVDCAYHREAWKFNPPAVEIVCADFEEAAELRKAADLAAVEPVRLADGPALQLMVPGVEPRPAFSQVHARRQARRGHAPLPPGGLFDETARAQRELF